MRAVAEGIEITAQTIWILFVQVGLPIVAWVVRNEVPWVALCCLFYFRMLCVHMLCHRYWSHGSFTWSHRPMRYVSMILASMGGQGSPIVWAELHAQHHRTCDTTDDPHSPYNAEGGLLWKFIYVHGAHFATHCFSAYPPRTDLRSDRALCVLSHMYPVWEALLFACMYGILGSFPRTLGVVCLSAWLGWNTTELTNSVCHLWGERKHLQCKAGNVRWLTPLVLGDNWHANHHMHPKRASHGQGPQQPDPIGWMVNQLRKWGMIAHVHE